MQLPRFEIMGTNASFLTVSKYMIPVLNIFNATENFRTQEM